MTRRRDDQKSLKHFARLLRPYRGRLLGVIGLLFGLALVNMVKPAFVKVIIDDVFVNQNYRLLIAVLAGILVVYVARNVFYFLSKYTAVDVGESVCFNLRNRLFEHLQSLKLQFYRRNRPGQVSSRVMDDSYVIQTFIQDDLPKLLQALMLFVGLMAVIYAVNWPLALASTIVLPLHLMAFQWFKRPIKDSSRDAQEQIASVHGNLIEKFLGAEVVKGFSAEDREGRQFERAIEKTRRSQVRSKTWHVLQKVTADLIVGLGTIFLLGFGAWQVMGPTGMKTGTFVMFFAFVGMLYPTVLDLMSGFAKLTRASASIDRVFEMLEQGEREDTGAQRLTRPVEGAIRFEGVNFSYSDGLPVLRDVSFEIEAGQRLAIVGPSGAGKTTLCSMICRFNDPDMGHVAIDGVNVREWDIHHLRHAVSTAFQEAFLFNSTVMENLRYARPDASQALIEEVCALTGAADVIKRLPDGYHTRLGADGVSLSRGEKQRITLARALLKRPQILILDEATASVDPEAEASIVPAVLEAMEGRTTVFVTHHLDMIRYADKVVVMDEGRVQFEGSPEAYENYQARQRQASGVIAESETPPRRRRPGDESGFWPAMQMVLLSLLLVFTSAGPLTAAPDQKGPQADKQAPAKAQPAPAEKDQPKAKSKPKPKPKPKAPAGVVGVPPADAGKFLALPGTIGADVAEMVEIISGRLQAEMGYRPAETLSVKAPATPPKLESVHTLARRDGEGMRIVQLGYRTFASQPPHLWVYGERRAPGKPTVVNDHRGKVEAMVNQLTKARQQQAGAKRLADLASRKIELSYVEIDRCLGLLKALGYNVVEFTVGKGKSAGTGSIIEPLGKVNTSQLPVVLPVPATHNADRVTDKQPTTAAGPMMEMLVFYDPERPEQFGRLRTLIRDTIDLPARQIVIEAMILEISETGLEKLGVEWELQPLVGETEALRNIQSLAFGKLPSFASGEDDLLSIEIDDVLGHFNVELEALIRDGEAEVLSRPSVLTLNNRQAYIRVGEDIPIATTISGLRNSDKLSFNFRYINTGIELNVRPRVNADGQEISMQVHGKVSAEVPGEELEIFDNDNNLLAQAPKLSQRQVQTYTRIANNTPFIIGGLVSRDERITEDKVPLLGDIPLLGNLFKRTSVNRSKREVIIVITPYVLPEKQVVGRNLPKDEDAFDSVGNELFRDAYRIRAEDVFDLAFLAENRRLQRAQEIVRNLGRVDADVPETWPFSAFAGRKIPGEEILVYRQMYEVIKRRKLGKEVNPRKLIFFNPDAGEEAGFSVAFLIEHMKKLTGDRRSILGWQFERAMKDRAMAIVFTMQSRDGDDGEVLSQPVPQVELVRCEDRQQWSRLLWELNQPDEQGRPRHAILLQNRDDMRRLMNAVVLKRTVELNGSPSSMTLENFSLGRLLLMPSLKPDKVNLVDEQVAAYFFCTEQYYPALQQRINNAVTALQEKLEMPRYKRLLRKTEALPERE